VKISKKKGTRGEGGVKQIEIGLHKTSNVGQKKKGCGQQRTKATHGVSDITAGILSERGKTKELRA